MALAKIFCSLLVILSLSINETLGINLKVSHSQKTFYERQNVKTIKTKNGDTYDCVDFYDQPAFQHSRIKNHNYYPEMRPKVLPNDTTTIKNDLAEMSRFYTLENEGCPRGRVPIKRLSKDDHSRASAMLSKTHINNDSANGNQGPPPGTHLAILQTKASPNPPHYYGIGAYLSVWNPQVKENQYSSSRVTIQNGPESLQVGWMVNPTIYKDNHTHMFIHTNAGETHCYNTYCSGFVLVRSDFPPDIVMGGSSEHGKPPLLANFFIYRESTSGDWWLLVTEKLTPIGFWPGGIFSSLNKYGTYISGGGETYSPPDQQDRYPPMGSGAYPIGMTTQDAYVKKFEYANEKLQRIVVVDAEKFVDTKKYDIRDVGIVKGFGHLFYFGGYGG